MNLTRRGMTIRGVFFCNVPKTVDKGMGKGYDGNKNLERRLRMRLGNFTQNEILTCDFYQYGSKQPNQPGILAAREENPWGREAPGGAGSS